MNNRTDLLKITDLELRTRIGVTEEERKAEQRLLVSVSLSLSTAEAALADDHHLSVDYAEAVEAIKQLAKVERRTIERFAADVAEKMLQQEGVKSVEVTVKKFPPLGTKEVSVMITRPEHERGNQ